MNRKQFVNRAIAESLERQLTKLPENDKQRPAFQTTVNAKAPRHTQMFDRMFTAAMGEPGYEFEE